MKKANLIVLSFLYMLLWSCSSETKIEFVQGDSKIDVKAGDQLITTYMYGENLSKPVLYPVYSPSGEIVTRAYPFQDIEGESHDHPHHTGVSFTYGSAEDVNGNSFWANKHDQPPFTNGPKLPSIRQSKIEKMENGELATVSLWIDRNNKPLLEEKRIMIFKADEDEYTIDFDITLTAIDTVVTFQDTKEGMFAIRVADWLAESANGKLFKSTGEYINAEGDKTEKEIWAKRSAWVRLQGEKDGKTIGITIFHHPKSLNYPTYWHARGYGCFAANPIGQADYQKGRDIENPQTRTLVLNPGQSALFRFRVVIYDGDRNKEQVDKEFNSFSKE